MKLSELTAGIAAAHVRTVPDDPMLPVYLDAAVSHVLSYTGLSLSSADEYPDLTVAALILTADLYDNRQATVVSDRENRVNRTLESFMSAHDFNLLPGGE